MAVERGLSYDDIGQIKDFELLHMRFTEKSDDLHEHSFPLSYAVVMKKKMKRAVEDASSNSGSKSSYGTGISSGAVHVCCYGSNGQQTRLFYIKQQKSS